MSVTCSKTFTFNDAPLLTRATYSRPSGPLTVIMLEGIITWSGPLQDYWEFEESVPPGGFFAFAVEDVNPPYNLYAPMPGNVFVAGLIGIEFAGIPPLFWTTRGYRVRGNTAGVWTPYSNTIWEQIGGYP